MPKDIVMTGTALVTFRKVFKDVPEDEVQEILNMGEINVSINIDNFDLQDITGLKDFNIKAV